MAEDPLHDIIEAVRARLKSELDTQVQSLSQRHQQALDEQRTRIQAEAEQRWAAQLQAAREEVERQAAAAAVQRLRDIDAADSISDCLAAIVRTASSYTRTVALYVANGSQLEPWPAGAGVALDHGPHDSEVAESLVARAFAARDVVRLNGSACAIPLLLDGVAVGVLYGEADPEADGAPGWTDTLEAAARHGVARVAYLTALRTAQARQWLSKSPAVTTAAPLAAADPEETAASARRYARLVVSELKLYNESAVQEGRARRDLLTRLGPEIDRARRLYEQQLPASVPARSDYFQQELIQTLAGGDASLLG